MKPTNEEIAKVFMMHFGSDFRYSGSYGIVRKIAGITKGWDVIEDAFPEDHYRVDKCELLLMPLPSITDEHAIEVAKIAYPAKTAKDLWTPENGKEYLNFSPNVSCMIYSIYQQLILLGYAVPLFFGINHWANGKTAIELGIAIDKTSAHAA